MARRKNFSRAGRKEQIKTLFNDQIRRGYPNELTPYGIARLLEISPSTHLNKILAEMVNDEVLTVKSSSRFGRWDGRVFSLSKGHIDRPKRVRSMRLNLRGKVQEQLELWS